MKEKSDSELIGIFSRVCVRIFMLPASIFQAGSFSEWLRFWGRGWLFWRELALSYRLKPSRYSQSSIVGKLAGLGALCASAIIKQGGFLRIVSLTVHIFFREGGQGIRARYLQNQAPPPAFKPAGAGPCLNRILICDHRIPRPDSSAGDFTTMGILRDAVALGYDVVFLPADYAPSPEYSRKVEELGVTVITQGSGYATPAEYIAHEGFSFAMFYLIRLGVAEYLISIAREASPKAAIIFHAPDLVHLREERQALVQKRAAACAGVTRQRELAVIEKVDAVVVLSDVEKKLLEQKACATRVELFPALYAPVLGSVPGFHARKDIFFLGGFSHAPNIDAVVWFAETIWPQIHEELPNALFRIIGAEPTRQVLGLAKISGVKVDGFVENLAPIWSGMRIGVAPLRFGAGIKGKVALTMGAGIPCVCSPIAAEGMGFDDGCAFLVAESKTDYIEKIVRLYQDESLWQTLSKSGAALIEKSFGVKACTQRLAEILSTFRFVD